MSVNYEAQVSGLSGADWSNTELEDLIRAYLNDSNKWVSVSTPAFSKLEFKDTVGFSGLGTYQINVVDAGGEINPLTVGDASFEFFPQFEVQIYARKPKNYGKSFPELNNIQNQVINIFINYQKNAIAGLLRVWPSAWSAVTNTNDAYSSSGTHLNDVWAAKVLLRGHYIKSWKTAS